MTAKQVRTSGTPRAEVLRVLAHNLAKSCNYLEGQNRTFITHSFAAQAGGHIHKQQTGDKSGCKSARQQMAGREAAGWAEWSRERQATGESGVRTDEACQGEAQLGRALFPDLLSPIAPFYLKYVLILTVYYSEIYLLLCPFKDLYHHTFKAFKLHGKGAAALSCLINKDNSKHAFLQNLSRGRGHSHSWHMVHTIADQFPISYSIITIVNLKWFPKQKQRMSSAF